MPRTFETYEAYILGIIFYLWLFLSHSVHLSYHVFPIFQDCRVLGVPLVTMDKALHILQKPTDSTDKVLGGGTGIALVMGMGDREFTEQSIRLTNKIPLVKPYFKKKQGQRKLDSKCLRALQDPILTTLLSTDALVTGDGVFVPRNPPPRTVGNLCTAAVVKQARVGGPVCRKESSATGVTAMITGDTEMADAAAELEETEGGVTKVPVDLQRVTIDPNERRFQLKLHPRARDVAAAPPTPDSPLVTSPCQRGNTMIDLFASKALRGANCLTIKDSKKNPSLQADKGEIFQDKSEEASLDLVFELLTQLQYHTHQADSVSICVDFLQGLCVYGSDCAYHHTVLPYHWQIRKSDSQSWQSVADDSQEQLERLYCNPDNEQVRLKFQMKLHIWPRERGRTGGRQRRRERGEGLEGDRGGEREGKDWRETEQERERGKTGGRRMRGDDCLASLKTYEEVGGSRFLRTVELSLTWFNSLLCVCVYVYICYVVINLL
uniref:TCDD-inducible poly(ADP-ribose) polymerase n=1 Tax=Hucho hucho TaxID=62062 RepID=A0A4W5Q6P8_9TELE